MKKFVGLILILASVLLSSVSNLHAGSYDSYLAIIGKSGKPRPDQKLAAINQLITNGADQNNNVILDLLANKILDLKYHELIKLDLSAKLAQILNKLPELSSASDSSSAPTVASSSPASFSGAPSLPSSSGGSALDKYVSEPKDNDALFLILTNAEDLLNVVIVDYLINRLKLKNYSDLIKMRLYEKEKLLIDSLTSIFAPGAGADEVTSPVTGIASYTEPEAEAAGSYHGTYYSVGDTVVNPMAGLNKTQATTITPSTSPMFTGAGTGAGTGVSTSPVAPTGKPAGGPAFLSGLTGNPMAGLKKTGIPTQTASTGSSVPAVTSAGSLKPAVTSAFGKSSIVATTDTGTGPGMAGAGSGTGAGAGAGTSLTGAGVEPGPNARIILNIVKDLTPSEQSALLSYPDTQLSNVVNRIDTSLGGTASGGFTKTFMIKGSLTSAGLFETYKPSAAKPTSSVSGVTSIGTATGTSAGPLKPVLGKPATSAGAGTGPGMAGAGTGTVASVPLTREQQEKAYREQQEKAYFESFGAPSSAAISDLAFYETLQNDHTTPEDITNQKIMAALFAPQKVTSDLISNRSMITPAMGISNEAVLDFLLRDRFNQNPETVRQMILQDKQIGVVRFLLPYAIRQRVILPKIGTDDIGFVEYPSPVDAAYGTKDMIVRGETLTNSYRHLDFRPESEVIWLVNRHIFIYSRNDYSANLPTYRNVSSFYWMPDGETFILVYNDGKSGTYRGVDGQRVGELREPIIMEAPSAAEAPSAPTGLNKKGQAVQITGETMKHFRARLRAKLNEFEAKSITGRDPALIRAMAILTLDKSFIGLTDDDITSFQIISEDDVLLANNLSAISAKDPNSLTLLDKAIVYYAIKQAKIPADNSLFEKWNKIFNAMDLAVIAGQNTQGASGIPSDVITNSVQLADFVSQAIVKYPLNETEKEQLGRPVSYTNKTAISELIAKNPGSASNFDKAKAFYLIKANIVKSSDPKVVEWRSVLNI